MQASDRTSMANSLELRAPFVSKNLVLALLNISSKNKFSKRYNKRLLVEGLSDILPEFILTQTKKPFNPPMRGIILANIGVVRAYLCDDNHSRVLQLLSKDFGENEVKAFELGKCDNSTYLRVLASLECWLRKTYPATISTV